MESKKYNKLVNVTKKKQTYRYREKAESSYREEEKGTGNIQVQLVIYKTS